MNAVLRFKSASTRFSIVSFFGSAEMVSGCNSDCQCSQDVYNPVCGIDGILYYSPCYAGCQTENIGDEKVATIINLLLIREFRSF